MLWRSCKKSWNKSWDFTSGLCAAGTLGSIASTTCSLQMLSVDVSFLNEEPGAGGGWVDGWVGGCVGIEEGGEKRIEAKRRDVMVPGGTESPSDTVKTIKPSLQREIC